MKAVRSSAWRRIVTDRALIKQGNRCRYCKSPLKRVAATADHVVPKSENGRDVAANIVACCRRCNGAKGSMHARKFKAMVRGHEKPATYGIAVRATMYRLEKRTGKAVANILAVVGARP